MKDFIIGLFATILILIVSGVVIYKDRIANQDKQHIKIQRVGCHQYRINEFTNEVQHLEGCNSVDHLNESE